MQSISPHFGFTRCCVVMGSSMTVGRYSRPGNVAFFAPVGRNGSLSRCAFEGAQNSPPGFGRLRRVPTAATLPGMRAVPARESANCSLRTLEMSKSFRMMRNDYSRSGGRKTNEELGVRSEDRVAVGAGSCCEGAGAECTSGRIRLTSLGPGLMHYGYKKQLQPAAEIGTYHPAGRLAHPREMRSRAINRCDVDKEVSTPGAFPRRVSRRCR
jgi:hypothetical protein